MIGLGPVGHDGVGDIPLKFLCYVDFTVRQDDVKLLRHVDLSYVMIT
jgi:hypothetical protein